MWKSSSHSEAFVARLKIIRQTTSSVMLGERFSWKKDIPDVSHNICSRYTSNIKYNFSWVLLFLPIQSTSKWHSDSGRLIAVKNIDKGRESIFQIFYFYFFNLVFTGFVVNERSLKLVIKCLSVSRYFSSNNFFLIHYRVRQNPRSIQCFQLFTSLSVIIHGGMKEMKSLQVLIAMPLPSIFRDSPCFIPPLHFHNWIGPYVLRFYSKNLQSCLCN